MRRLDLYRTKKLAIFFCFVAFYVAAYTLFAQNNTQSKTAAQAFKNIQVLKDVPADQLISSMQFISASLGVHCEHCHVEGAFDKDDKKPKKTARAMMQMMFAINQNNFEGHREVTCYSCHRSALNPVGVPIIAAQPAPLKETPAPAMPSHSADDVLAKYVQAAGGSNTISAINTEVQKGKIALGQGVQFPVEIYLKQPGKRTVITQLPSGTSIEVVNGNTGWSSVPNRPVRLIGSGDLQLASLDADTHFPADIKDRFTEFKVLPDEKIGSQNVTVVRAMSSSMPPLSLYFGQNSGLLLRMVRYVDSPLGLNPTQIDFSDYRDVKGARIPFQWTVAQPQGSYTIQLDQVQINVPVEDTKFVKPEAAPSGSAH